ncbi:MAG: hypothetical protein MUC69_04030 [Gemmatimonadales bacterium]|nr:hypothetical protein [Gemmatimonadales bacterium]
MAVIGWDIGGVHVKVARVANGAVLATTLAPCSIERDLETLPEVLRRLAHVVGATARDRHAITMTAELSQRFRTKGEGVGAILDAHRHAFPDATSAVLDTAGRLVDTDAARARPLAVAASNWVATATLAARAVPDALLLDMGSTTTDIIPLVAGRVAAAGRTDPDRLASGELVYTGALRTPIEAIVRAVPWRDGFARVSAEGFATTGDVHLWLGTLPEAACTVPTADGRPATRTFAAERLARVACADRTMVTDADLDRIALAVDAAQQAQLTEALGAVRARHPGLSRALVTGIGDAIAARAARASGWSATPLREAWGNAADVAPAAAAGLLLESAHA